MLSTILKQHLVIRWCKISCTQEMKLISWPRILNNAGLLKMRREGTKNYYYFDPDQASFDLLIDVLAKAKKITSELPDRNGDND